MTFRANPFLEKLDRTAELTGMPAFSRRAAKDTALPFRFVPVIFLAMAVFGLVLQAWIPTAGWSMIMILWMGTFSLLLTGPMRRQPGDALDERERALIRTGHFGGLVAVAILAIGGCLAAGLSQALTLFGVAPLWLPRHPTDWLALGFFLLVVEANVAVLVASWKSPRVPMTDEG